MIYTYSQLQNLSFEASITPMNRYMHRFLNHRREIKNLKAHEKDFLFQYMSILRDDNDERVFDLESIDEASEYLFYKLILIYSENLDFNKPTLNSSNQIISANEMKKDKAIFDKLYIDWVEQIKKRKGKYLNIIETELNRRIKQLDSLKVEGKINDTNYDYHRKYLFTMSYYIYYRVKLFFDGQKEKFILLNILGEDIIINIYSFVHILFRHYIPSMDIGQIDRSINDPLPFLDLINLPISIRELLIEYFNLDKSPLIPSREYFLFSFNDDRYIIWLKYSKLEELNNNYGYEFRTLYKCKEERDFDKFEGLAEYKLNADLSFFY